MHTVNTVGRVRVCVCLKGGFTVGIYNVLSRSISVRVSFKTTHIQTLLLCDNLEFYTESQLEKSGDKTLTFVICFVICFYLDVKWEREECHCFGLVEVWRVPPGCQRLTSALELSTSRRGNS